MNIKNLLHKFFIEIILQKAIREGLLLCLPFLLIGAMALIIKSIPIEGYQDFIQSLAGGHFYYLLNAFHTYTIFLTPLLLLFTISVSFARATCEDIQEILFYPLISLLSYLIFCSPHGAFSFLELFNATQTFTSIVVAITACSLFYFFCNFKYTSSQYFLKTHSHMFNTIYRIILPAALVLLIFMSLQLFVGPTLKDTKTNLHLQLFAYLGNNFFSTALCVFLDQCYWFIGIHGSNIMEAMTINVLQPRLFENVNALASGLVPMEIYTKTFLDVFVGIGGCGSIFSLILGIFLFARLPHTKRIAKLSFIPAIFNISEIILLGLPIICNSSFFLPFLLVPISNLAVSSLAMYAGLVPVTTKAVEWTTPPFINAYISTGSFAGSILQLLLIVIGIFIYRPFILKYEQREDLKLENSFKSLINESIRCEKLGKSPDLLGNNEFSDIARLLSSDFHQALQQKELYLFYQPQIAYDGSIYGGEALLRWKHPQFGYIYPPLIIFLAKENNWLDELGMYVIEQTCKDLEYLDAHFAFPLKLSVNVAPPQLYNKNFCRDVRILLSRYNFGQSVLAFELTEQIALSSTQEIMDRLTDLKSMGILLSMDDFGMGHSSVMYLQNSEFDIVKLDGNLTKKVLFSERSIDIITAITGLSKKFNFKVIAEYVETKEQRDKLADLGCYIYQGWLYSQAVPREVFIRYLNEHYT